MKAEIKLIYSADVADLENWCPLDPEEVYVPLDLYIGPIGEPEADIFQVVLTTPAALRVQRQRGVRPTPRHCLVVIDYEWPAVRRRLDEVVADCTGEDWEEIAACLSQHFRWEFEGYRPR